MENGGNATSSNSKIVYDCIDPSPFYENSKEPYLDEAEAIDLPPSSVCQSPTPPRYTTSGSFGSMRTWLKYIGRGFPLLTFFQVAPLSSDR